MKKTHKIISVLLVLAMMLTMAPLSLTAFAATPTPYDGVPVTPQKISSGNYARLGLTSSNWSQFKGYYAIRNAKELYGFADIVNNTLAHNTNNLNAVLLQDIVINANGGNTYDWRPLYGTGNNRDYRGIIDGNGHYISGIYCTQAAYKVNSTECVSGLIGEFEGTVKNLIIKDSTFAPSQHLGMNGGIGAITGYPQDCTIINCRVENTKISSIDKYGQLGGFTGYGNGQGATIKNCASINVTFSGGGYNAPISNLAPFSNCYTSASDSHTCSNISVEHKEVKATCEYPGLSNYKYCLVCGNITSGTKTETPATGHTWTPATCQAPKTCSSCGLTEGSAETHKYTTYTLSSNAMCGTNAKKTASCDYGCGTTDTREISGTALVHSCTYSASGNTITAVCANGENCPNPQSTLKILAPAELYTDGTISREAVIDNQLVEATDYTVSYSTADGSAPKTAGTYTASVTVGGATASVEFTLSNYAAKVTDKDGNLIDSYKTIEDAISAASDNNGSTLVLLDDIYITDFVVIGRCDFTIDLNGKKLITQNNKVLSLSVDAVVTLKDSGEGGLIEVLEAGTAAIHNFGKLTIESVTVKGDCGIDNMGTLTVTDCTVIADYFEAVTNSGTAYIYSGYFTSPEHLGLNNYGTAYVYGGEYSGISNCGTIYISGGKVRRNDYAALSLGEGTCEITGGSFSGTDFENGLVSGTPYGEFTVCCLDTATLIIRGGEFPNGFTVDGTTANALLADGYHFRNEQGKIVDGSSKIIEGKVTVEKGADFSADAVVTAEDVVYNGAAQEPDVTVTIGGKTLTEGKDYTLTFANNINAGTATVTVKAVGQAAGGIVGGGNSNAGNSVESVYTGEITKEFTVLKADSSIDVYPEANKLTYNGEAQTLIVIGDTYDGMIVYSLDGEKYSPLPPTGTNAGEYTVYYKVEGNSNHNDTEPETLTVTIGKKSVTASATAPDKIYDGTTTVDSSAINITLDGIIDGDDVVIDRCTGLFLNANAGNNKTVQIAYYISGEDVNNYEIYEDYISVPEAEYYFIETKANILPRDIADAQITLGDALTYNGAEQTQSISGVTVDGLEVTYTVSGNTATNVGVYELTITGNGNFSGTKTALFEVAPDTSAIDALTVDNVKSSDKEAIEAVAKQIENAVTDLAGDEKKAEYKAIADKCNELLAKIDATADEIARIDEAVNGYDTETVTSADIPALGKLIDDIKALADGNNITEDEKSALEENNEAIDELIEKLTEVAEEIKRVDEAVKSYDENSVKSTDSENLDQLKEDIQALIDSENITENEKTALEDMIKNIDGLEDKVEEIENQLEEIKGVENNFNPEKVSSDDKAAIEEKIAEIENVNPDNLTEEQKAEYAEIKAGFEALLEEIEKAGSEVDAIGAELEMFDEEKATIFREDEIEALKAKIDEILADENMGEAEKAELEEYKAQCDNLIEIINTPAKYLSMRLFCFIWDALHWLSSHVVFIFNWMVAMF